MDSAVSKALNCFNSKWQARYELFRRYVPPPHWAPGLIISPALRVGYEQYLPVSEFLHDVRKLGRLVLPHSSWVPFKPRWPLGIFSSQACPFLSLPDFWQTCPLHFAGKLFFESGDLLPFLCALADPPQFGTDVERYPEQLQVVRSFLTNRNISDTLRILDLGCGTGHGLFEIVNSAVESGYSQVLGLGITLFPLEAWMAMQRTLPHDAGRTRSLRKFNHLHNVHVIAADSLVIPARAVFDLIVCNGLVGGRFLNARTQMVQLLREVKRVLAPGGLFTLANRFHDGSRASQELFCDSAGNEGFVLSRECRGVWVLRTQLP